MSTALHKNAPTIAHADEVLRDLSGVCNSLRFATFLTDDGFEVTHLSDDGEPRARMASMASSMQALGDAVARELKIGKTEYIIIAAEAGYVIQLRVPDHPLVLSAYFDAGETLGKALSVARLAASNMASMQLARAA
jgi:predicted regulator of Ras-like GTPase activity (Roadblock/LC7/MglB family)